MENKIRKHRTGYLFKRGNNWYVRYQVDGQVVARALRDEAGQAITTHREAEEARRKVMAPIAIGTEAAVLEALVGRLAGRKTELAQIEDAQNPATTIESAWARFLECPNRPDSGPETLYQYECQWDAFRQWMKDKHPEAPALRNVTKAIAEEYAGHLNHGRFSPNTYNKHLNLLTLVFRVLKDRARVTLNPWEEIQRKRLVTHSRRELTLEELRTVCQSAAGELRTLLGLGVYSGLRLGDCATLRWGEVDLDRGMIRRLPNKTARRNPKPVIVPIHPVLSEMLVQAPRSGQSDYVLPETAELYNRRLDAVTDLIQDHFKACKIQVWKPGTGPGSKEGKRAVIEVGFHSLRHTFVSLCRESNAPLAVVESIVGHSSPAMTRHYTHVGELAAGQAVAMLPAVVGDLKAAQVAQPLEDRAAKAVKLLERMTAENWDANRKRALKLLAGVKLEARQDRAAAAAK